MYSVLWYRHRYLVAIIEMSSHCQLFQSKYTTPTPTDHCHTEDDKYYLLSDDNKPTNGLLL